MAMEFNGSISSIIALTLLFTFTLYKYLCLLINKTVYTVTENSFQFKIGPIPVLSFKRENVFLFEDIATFNMDNCKATPIFWRGYEVPRIKVNIHHSESGYLYRIKIIGKNNKTIGVTETFRNRESIDKLYDELFAALLKYREKNRNQRLNRYGDCIKKINQFHTNKILTKNFLRESFRFSFKDSKYKNLKRRSYVFWCI